MSTKEIKKIKTFDFTYFPWDDIMSLIMQYIHDIRSIYYILIVGKRWLKYAKYVTQLKIDTLIPKISSYESNNSTFWKILKPMSSLRRMEIPLDEFNSLFEPQAGVLFYLDVVKALQIRIIHLKITAPKTQPNSYHPYCQNMPDLTNVKDVVIYIPEHHYFKPYERIISCLIEKVPNCTSFNWIYLWDCLDN